MTDQIPETVPVSGDPTTEWPIELAGITETVIATPNPDRTWHQASFGLHPDTDHTGRGRCWGQTKTASNLERTGEAVFQFLTDPLVFAETALGDCNTPAPVFQSTHAWVRVGAVNVATGCQNDTQWSDWQFTPQTSAIRKETVPVVRRGTAAVIEALVAASRLDVPGYDQSTLIAQIDRSRSIINRCGTPRDKTALRRIEQYVDTQD